jgi:hypothetical protein
MPTTSLVWALYATIHCITVMGEQTQADAERSSDRKL